MAIKLLALGADVMVMREYSFGFTKVARKFDAAVNACLEDGISTPDIGGSASTSVVTDAIIRN